MGIWPMFWTTLIAHGILGPYDEIYVPLVVLAFFAVIGITWLRSRNAEIESPAPDPNHQKTNQPDNDDSHFTLD
jgi:hypothetical protein